MVIYMYTVPAGRQTHARGPNYFQNFKYPVHLPISCKFCPSKDILTMLPIQMHRRPMNKKIFKNVFAIYSYCGHLGHVTLTILTSLALIGKAISEKLF